MNQKNKFKFSFAHMYVVLLVCIFFIAMGGMVYHFLMNQFCPPAEGALKYVGKNYICEIAPDPNLNGSKTSITNKKNRNFITQITESIDTYATTYSSAAEKMVLLGARCKKLTGLPPELAFRNEQVVVRMKNGHVAYSYERQDNSKEIESIIAFSDYLEKHHSQFLYFEHPTKFKDALYEGMYKDYSNEMGREIVSDLNDAGISVLSIEEKMEEMNSDWSSFFFKTDHHWNPQTGIWATSVLSQKLNNEFGYDIDVSLFDESNYTIDILENASLGSPGKKVTSVYAEPEDFPVVIPKYETDVTVFNSYDNSTKTGSIQKTLFDYSKIDPDTCKDIAQNTCYSFYGYGDQALIKIHNNKVSDGRRLLMIKDSFADVMFPFLAAEIEYLDVIDLRVFKGSLRAYIQETKPDTVVMVYGASLFGGKKFYAEAFDFN